MIESSRIISERGISSWLTKAHQEALRAFAFDSKPKFFDRENSASHLAAATPARPPGSGRARCFEENAGLGRDESEAGERTKPRGYKASCGEEIDVKIDALCALSHRMCASARTECGYLGDLLPALPRREISPEFIPPPGADRSGGGSGSRILGRDRGGDPSGSFSRRTHLLDAELISRKVSYGHMQSD